MAGIGVVMAVQVFNVALLIAEACKTLFSLPSSFNSAQSYLSKIHKDNPH